jgi:YidC/Oxa1 family membrane protein insertase
VGQLWDVVLNAVFAALQFFYGFTHDYGWAIILLTLAMRIILVPLTWKQTKSMYELQRIQPKIKELQEKYKNDKEKLQEETLKFYQENKVNPFGGCLPLLLQMPVFIAMYNVLGGTPEKPGKMLQYLSTLPPAVQVQAVKWMIGPLTILPDITMSPARVWGAHAAQGIPGAIWAVLPYAIFVVLFGLSVWLPQYMITQDPTQRRTGTYMAVFMLYIGWISPAGVLIYWVTSSAWQVGQQMLTMRMLKEPEEAPAALKGSSKKSKPSGQELPGKSQPSKGKKSKGA